MPKHKPQRILGIDPGYGRLGYGLLEEKLHTLQYLDYGCIETPAGMAAGKRLSLIAAELRKILTRHQPSTVAIEKLFFAKNTKTALGVSEARGVALLVAQEFGAHIVEFTPIEIKIALTGYGQAEKVQVQRMVEQLLHITKAITSDDAADALAIALCAAHTKTMS